MRPIACLNARRGGNMSVFAVLFAGVSAQTTSQAQQTAAGASVPQACIKAGTDIQSACGPEIQAALKTQGINVRFWA